MPNTTGVPGRIICARQMPVKSSAVPLASVPAMASGPVAPSIAAGHKITGWPYSAKIIRLSSILSSSESGELVLISAMQRGCLMSSSLPPNSSQAASIMFSMTSLSAVDSMIALSEFKTVA